MRPNRDPLEQFYSNRDKRYNELENDNTSE